MEKKNAPKKKESSIENEIRSAKFKNVVGDSVNKHNNLEEANSFLAEGEIGQQNENL
ncbi:MAG TPA: hypothetical protein VIG98_14605 [Bacillus sp. (in: firmicutes)]